MIGISPRQLEVFVAIASADSARAAAEHLHLTQPAASMALAELERQLGASLFDRERGRLRINARGQALLPEARDVLARLRELQQRASDTLQTLRGELHVGASNTVGNYLVGDLLSAFVAAHAQVAVQLRVRNTDAIVAGVLDSSLDLGCVEGPVTHADIEWLPWREDALCVCARSDHRLAKRKRLRAADFADANWIMREHGSATRAQSERILAALPPGRTVLELDQAEAIKQAVIAGLGLALLPAIAVRDAVASGRLAVLPTPFLALSRKMSLIVHRRRYRGALIDAFLASVTSD